MANPPRSRGSAIALTLSNYLGLRDEPSVGHTVGTHDGQDLNHDPIWDVLVRPEIHAVSRPVLRHRLEGHPKIAQGELLVTNEDLAFAVDGHSEPVLCLERLRLRLRKRDVDA